MHKQLLTPSLTKIFFTSFISLSLLVAGSILVSSRANAATTTCELSFAITPNTISIAPGGSITRAVTVKNIGTARCKNVSYSMYYAGNETFVSSNPVARASNYYWVVGNLAPGTQSTTTIVTKHNASVDGTTVDTEGCATASNGADACATSSVAISGTSGPVNPVAPVVTPVPPIATSTPISTPTSTPVITPILPTTSGSEQGMWIWNYPSQMLTPAADAQLKTIQARGFNTVYITVDDYIDIATMTDGPAKTAATNTYFQNLAAFVSKATSYGMQVDAEAGWRDWAQSANRWKGFAVIDMVKAYNAAHPEAKLRGFEYDVEPYLLLEYETNKGPVLTDYVAFIDQSVQRLVGTDIQFNITIPHFYDDVVAWTPTITYNGTTDYTYNQLLKVLEQKPGSEILIMAYRNFFDGANGTRAVSETEVKEATGTHTKVIVGQETGNVTPSYVTYYGMSKTDVANAISTIGSAFSSYSNYGGTAVDYLDPYMALSN